jgi:hypothetical protein
MSTKRNSLLVATARPSQTAPPRTDSGPSQWDRTLSDSPKTRKARSSLARGPRRTQFSVLLATRVRRRQGHAHGRPAAGLDTSSPALLFGPDFKQTGSHDARKTPSKRLGWTL